MLVTVNVDPSTLADIRNSQKILKKKFNVKLSYRQILAWSLKQTSAALRGEAFFASKSAFDEETARGYARQRETLVAAINDVLATEVGARIATVERDGATCFVVVGKDSMQSVPLDPEVAESLRMDPAITDFNTLDN